MITVALKGLLGRKLRAFLTAAAIVLGVAMISGTYVLTDTIKAAFNTVFTEVYQNTDAVISGKSAIGNGNNNGNSVIPSFPQTLLARVRQLPGVAEAEGGIDDQARLVGRDGKVIASGGPGLAFSVNPAGNQRFNPLELTTGRWPSAPDEMAIDKATANKKHYSVGDTIGVIARGPVKTFRIVGLVKFGGLDSLGGASLSIFDLPTAQRLFDKVGRLDSIGVASKPNVSPTELVQEIRRQVQDSFTQQTLVDAIAEELERGYEFIPILDERLSASVNVSKTEDDNYLASIDSDDDDDPDGPDYRGIFVDFQPDGFRPN